MTTPRWLNAEERSAWLAYLDLSMLLDDYLDRQLRRDAGITHPDYALLNFLQLAPNGGLGMSELAECLKITRSRLTHAVTRLEKAGHVARHGNPADRRGQITVITPAGRELLERAAPGHVEAVRQAVFDVLTEEQVRQFGEVCRTIADTVQGVNPDPLPWHRR
jgi:DNA-binding MarR family transcriptional regulator